MDFVRVFVALLNKNWLIKKRAPFTSACELLLPFLFVCIFVGVYFQFSTVDYPDSGYTTRSSPLLSTTILPGYLTVMPLGILPYRLELDNKQLALVAASPALIPERDAFAAWLRATYPALSLKDAGFKSSSINLTTFSDTVLTTFDSEDALESFLRQPSYGLTSAPSVWAAIVFNAPRPQLDYSIRMNSSDIVNTNPAPVNILARGVDLETVKKYVSFNPATTANPFASVSTNSVQRQLLPGFMSLQLALDRWAINGARPSPDEMDPSAMFQLFASLVAPLVLTPAKARELTAEYMNASTTVKATMAAKIGGWLYTPESLPPQQVDLIPFPTLAYSANQFYSTVLPFLSFFFVLCLLFPVSRLIRGLVLEKEMKIREGMRMMGLNDAALFGSWLVFYAGIFAVLALMIAAVTANNMFKASSACG